MIAQPLREEGMKVALVAACKEFAWRRRADVLARRQPEGYECPPQEFQDRQSCGRNCAECWASYLVSQEDN